MSPLLSLPFFNLFYSAFSSHHSAVTALVKVIMSNLVVSFPSWFYWTSQQESTQLTTCSFLKQYGFQDGPYVWVFSSLVGCSFPGFLAGFPSSVSSLLFGCSVVWLPVTPWTAAYQASLSFTISQSLLKLTYFKSVMPPNHLIPCCPLLLPPSVFPSKRVFSNELALRMGWPLLRLPIKYRSTPELSPSLQVNTPLPRWPLPDPWL